MNPSTRPTVLPLSQLAEAVRAGVVLALEDRKAVEINGGALSPTEPILLGITIEPITLGMPVRLLVE